ncbi:MAG: response regulator transcription factor [Lachnospiraceae bacterium]
MELCILIADDDAVFRDLLRDILKKNQYKVLTAEDGKDALDVFWAHEKEIDLVILDVMMPKYSGLEVLTEIRSRSEVAILMLTALGDEKSEVEGLSKGADDYIAKPFKYEVFLARVQSLTRKARKARQVDITIGNLKIVPLQHKVFLDGAQVQLSKKEYEMLCYLIANENILLTRDQLIDRIWGYDFDGDIRTIDTHIKTLRAKIGNMGNAIKTVRGSGYRFEWDRGKETV